MLQFEGYLKECLIHKSTPLHRSLSNKVEDIVVNMWCINILVVVVAFVVNFLEKPHLKNCSFMIEKQEYLRCFCSVEWLCCKSGALIFLKEPGTREITPTTRYFFKNFLEKNILCLFHLSNTRIIIFLYNTNFSCVYLYFEKLRETYFVRMLGRN